MKEKKPAGYWTYDRCFAEAKKYKFKMDFRKGSAGAYDAAKDKGWLAEYTWLESRSLVKWTYDTCYEEAKKYNTRSSFGKKAGAAYKVALENGWLEDYSWFISDRKPVGYWTYERCREEAMKCHMRSEFASKSSVAYDHARKNGWLEDYIWFTTDTTPSGYWTFERCYEEAKKYKRKKDFLDANPRAYRAAYAKGWLKNYTWFESRIKWTYETCYAVAKQCKTKRDFEKAYGRAYQVARKNGWLQDYEWLVSNRVDVINGEFDNVYSYYFDDYNAIYIGRTIRPRRRDREHIFNTKNDTVARFAFEHNCPVPPMIILEDGLSLKKGQEREDYWINYYKEQGYIILNSARTGVGIGSLGTIGGTKWTKGKCYKEAQKYTYRKEFQRGSVGAYTHALKMGWIKDYIWFNRPQNWNQKWDNNTCYEEALKYHTTGDFKLNSPRAYEVSRKKGWIKDYVWLENTVRCISKKWTYEVCLELAKTTAEVTHNHPEGIKGAQATVAIIWAIRNGHKKKEIKKWVEEEFGYNLSKTYDQLKNNHRYNCICQVSIPAAFICWYEGKSYEDVIRKAVSLGGDADTEAAIAGAFAAADSNMPVNDDLVFDLTRFFPMDFMNIFNEFHNEYE